MTSKFIASTVAAIALAVVGLAPSMAAPAQQTSVKFGYFNLALVKASYPGAAGSEALRVQAENQLRQDVQRGNEALQKAQEAKKPKEEIEKMARDLQVEINAKQQALIQLVQSQTQMATQAIAGAVANVAKDKGLDVVVDGAAVFSGGEKIVTNGEDITEAIVKVLAPNAIRPSSGGSAPAAAPKATPAAGGK
jgi:Skp family chaperone for outer membrane proteins